MTFKLYNNDCLKALKKLPDNSIDSCVTDPPYGIAFMGKDWDNFSASKNVALGKQSPANEKSKEFPRRGKPIGGWSEEDRQAAYNFEQWTENWAKEVLRVLKPGGFLLSFCSPRMYHRMTCGIEDAGFQIRDQVMWLYGSGFPKSHNVSKSIDREAGAERKVVRTKVRGDVEKAKKSETTYASASANKNNKAIFGYGVEEITEPATDEAKKWDGWGTALKPAHEPIVVARKPFKQSVAQNVLEHGTGAINIDECRIDYEKDCRLLKGGSYGGNRKGSAGKSIFGTGNKEVSYDGDLPKGRWPANVIHDGIIDIDEGRFFYCAKASKADRDEGLDKLQAKKVVTFQTENGTSGKASSLSEGRNTEYRNIHPTVKPTELMKYLCRLVTQKGGTVLDPFMGSGTTGKAAMLEGFNFIGIEMNKEYYEIAELRINHALNNKSSTLEDFLDK